LSYGTFHLIVVYVIYQPPYTDLVHAKQRKLLNHIHSVSLI